MRTSSSCHLPQRDELNILAVKRLVLTCKPNFTIHPSSLSNFFFPFLGLLPSVSLGHPFIPRRFYDSLDGGCLEVISFLEGRAEMVGNYRGGV